MYSNYKRYRNNYGSDRWDEDRLASRNNNSNIFKKDSLFSSSTFDNSKDGACESSIFSSDNSSSFFSANIDDESRATSRVSVPYNKNRWEPKRNVTHIRDEETNTELGFATDISSLESTYVFPCATASRNIYFNYSLRQSNLFQFAPKEDTDLLKLTFLYAIARMIYEGETNKDALVVVMAAEYASDFLHEDRLLYGRYADNYFVAVMEKAVRDPRFIEKVHISPKLLDTLTKYNLPRQYPTPSPIPLTGKQYMHILIILSSSLEPKYINCDLVALITAMIPCLQLDGVSNGFVDRVVDIVKRTLNINIAVNIKSCRLFYSRFLRDLNDDEIEMVFSKLRSALPQVEELRNILRKTPGGGLLPISLIGRALEKCQDFPWTETLELYKEDWRGVDLAIKAINNDVYYGYKVNKSEYVDPKNYENLAWLAKTLCVVKLKDNYDGFDDWVLVPKKKEKAMKLIEKYLNGE